MKTVELTENNNKEQIISEELANGNILVEEQDLLTGHFLIFKTRAEIEEETAVYLSNRAKDELIAVDEKSIRSLREWLSAQPDAPQWIKDYETRAIELRNYVK